MPRPAKAPQGTLPRPILPSSISDSAGVLTAADLAALNARIEGIRQGGLGTVRVAIIRSTDGKTAQSLAREIHRAWQSGDGPRTLPMGRTDSVLLLIVLDSTGCAVAASGGDGADQFADAVTTACTRSLEPQLRAGQYARAVSGGLVLIENRLRTAAGIGLAPGSAPPPAPREPFRVPAWLLDGAGVAAIIVAVGVFVRRRMQIAARKCVKCGRTMELASENTRARLLDEAQEQEELLGNARYLVWSCHCGHTRVQAIRSGG